MQISSVNMANLPLERVNKEESANSSFLNILSDAIENANITEAQDNLQTTQLITGNSNDLHSTLIAMEKADLALQFTVQIRNKILDAYNEVMRMQV